MSCLQGILLLSKLKQIAHKDIANCKTHVYTCMHTHACTHTNMHMHIYHTQEATLHTYTHTYHTLEDTKHTHTHTHTHTHIYIHTHTISDHSTK